MPAPRVAAAVAALVLAGCTPPADGTGGAPRIPEPVDTIATSAAGDTLPPPLLSPADEAEPAGDGPLYAFHDSVRIAADYWQPHQWGFRDASGRVVLPPRHHYTAPMFEGRAAFAVAGEWGQATWGYVNAAGRVAIPPRFDGAGRFRGGRALVMAGEDFMFIDTTGAVVDRLVPDPAARPALPPPCDSCSVGEYAQRFARTGEPMRLHVQPIVGESYRRVAVQRHPDGVLSVAEGGYEHWAYTLRIPGITIEEGVALAKRILGEGQYAERATRDEEGGVVLDALGSQNQSGNAVITVRVRNGVVAISHSDGS